MGLFTVRHSINESSQYTQPTYIYIVCMCIVTGFLYLAYKDLEQYIEAERMANEPNEIIVSHIA